VYLPAVAAPDIDGYASLPGPDRERGTETLLLAEDDLAVRTLMCTVLRTNGYTVVEAADGADAMRIAEGHVGRIDLLVTDVVMPSLGGRALLERMRAARPTLRVLYVSGYVDDEVMRRGGLDADEALLAKPFTADDLLQAVHAALSPREQSVANAGGLG
jgi:CheY-like chemotaxis protein